uniref:FAM69 protein-kinase domain-containing protein n=1 Tax=Anopheles epiroticus TaxID=199890 RepID=A0A182PVE3_9DIPT
MVSSGTHYYVLLFIAIVLQYISKENSFPKSLLADVCEYDSRMLCPECFSDVPECEKFDKIFKLHGTNFFNMINSIFNSHSTRMGSIREQNTLAVMKYLNRDNTIEKLLQQYCDVHSLSRENCKWAQHDGNLDQAKEFIENSILDSERIEGTIFCPIRDNRQSLRRFLGLFEPTDNEMWNLVAVRINVEPLLLKLFAKHKFNPFHVPKLLHTFGFSILESYEGKTLQHYYGYPLKTRMLIASELIKAAFRFTEGIHGFRFFLTDINPDNVVVDVSRNSQNVRVAFVDLDNVILLDSWSEIFVSNHGQQHVHSRIECNGCFAYVQEDICRYQNSDLNLFATCQLLLENLNGNYAEGLLHYNHATKSSPLYNEALQMLHSHLKECVYCQPPDCRNRSLILKDMLRIIDQTIN